VQTAFNTLRSDSVQHNKQRQHSTQ